MSDLKALIARIDGILTSLQSDPNPSSETKANLEKLREICVRMNQMVESTCQDVDAQLTRYENRTRLIEYIVQRQTSIATLFALGAKD